MHNKLIDLYKKESLNVFNNVPNKQIDNFIEQILLMWSTGKRVFVCANGGGVSYVANLVIDLNLHPFTTEDKEFPIDCDKRFKATSLCESVAVITAIANDLGPDHIFSEQLKYEASDGDWLIAITGSGSSRNIAKAIFYANKHNINVVCITKNKDSVCAKHSDHIVEIAGDSNFPGQTGGNNNNFHFEDCISKITHIAVGILKQEVFKKI